MSGRPQRYHDERGAFPGMHSFYLSSRMARVQASAIDLRPARFVMARVRPYLSNSRCRTSLCWQVAQFLSGCGERSLLDLHQSATGLSLADTFRKHGVRGIQLVRLDEFSGNQQLKAPPFSVASLGQRLKLLDAVKVLIEEEVEAQVSSTASTAAGAAQTRPASVEGVAEMIGRTCASAESLRAASTARGQMATVPAWRSTAFPPSGWVDPGEAGRTVPSTELELEFVFGYGGSRARGNVCCNDAGEIIFPASHVAIVFNIETRTQVCHGVL